MLLSGKLQKMVDEDGVTGGTSNPSIFEKAIAAGTAYDDHMRELIARDASVPDIFDALTVADVQQSATSSVAPTTTKGADGYASLEVPPDLAYNTDATIDNARRLFRALDRPNVMIKIPGTGRPSGGRAMPPGRHQRQHHAPVQRRELRARGTDVHSALEKRVKRGEPVSGIASVASFS